MANPQRVTTTNNGQIVRSTNNEGKQKSLATLLQDMGPQIAQALPKHVSADRMARIALTALRANNDLAKCTPASFLGSVLSAAQLGLEVNTPLGHAYLVPFKGVCTLILGYKGMMDLARRSGQVASIYAHLVRPGDHFAVRLGLEQTVEHVPSEDPARDDKPFSHVYAVAKLKGGDPVFVVLTRAQVDKFKSRSMTAKSNFSPWTSDYEAMALKTAVRRLFTWLPVSVEMARAAALDEAHETGTHQSFSFDPSVTEALEAHGIASDPDEPAQELEEPPAEREPGID